MAWCVAQRHDPAAEGQESRLSSPSPAHGGVELGQVALNVTPSSHVRSVPLGTGELRKVSGRDVTLSLHALEQFL